MRMGADKRFISAFILSDNMVVDTVISYKVIVLVWLKQANNEERLFGAISQPDLTHLISTTILNYLYSVIWKDKVGVPTFNQQKQKRLHVQLALCYMMHLYR